MVCLGLWIVQGFDSSPLQILEVLLTGIPGVLSGQKSWNDVIGIYNRFYGKEMHYSAFVIYVLLFVAVSLKLAAVKVKGFKNVSYSFFAMFTAIAMFEWFWIFSFGIFQNQPWVYTWQMPQLRILLQNTVYSITGIFGGLYMWIDSYQLKDKMIVGRNWQFSRSWMLWLLIVLSVAVALFWIYYPGPVQQLSVPLKNGQIWHSSRLFPQTLYTIKVDPGGAVNAGDWFWIENNWIHAVNTVVKVFWALLIYQIFKVKKT